MISNKRENSSSGDETGKYIEKNYKTKEVENG
jgi:hypothetical protein